MNRSALIARYLPTVSWALFCAVASLGIFSGGAWGGIGIGMAALMLLGAWIAEKKFPLPRADLALMVVLILSLGAALNGFSYNVGESWTMWLRLVTIFVPLSFLSSALVQKYALHPQLFRLLPWVAGAAAVALGLELRFSAPLMHWFNPLEVITRYNRGFSYFVLLAFPLAAVLWVEKQRDLLTAFLVALVVPTLFTESRAGVLALAAGAASVGGTFLLPRAMVFLAGLMPVAAVGTPFLARWVLDKHPAWAAHLPPSWQARMEIWDYLCYRIMERPWFGWGLGTTPDLPFESPHKILYVWMQRPAPHAHNAMVQLWLDLGVPGVLIGIGFAWMVLRWITGLEARLRPFALGSYVAAWVIALCAYNLWTDSLWAAFALVALLFALLKGSGFRVRGSGDIT